MKKGNPKSRTIAIVGPESSGKTTLAKCLAEAMAGVWLPEYARERLIDSNYSEEDVLQVAREQLARELDLVRSDPSYAIFDTDAIVLKIWFSERFGYVPDFINRHLDEQSARVYLLTYPDLEWQSDPRRESKDDLMRLFSLYEAELSFRGFRYGVVRGLGSKRNENAIALIEELTES